MTQYEAGMHRHPVHSSFLMDFCPQTSFQCGGQCVERVDGFAVAENAQVQCGPVAQPVSPTAAMTCPCATVSPDST